jgi:stearoyl-CoA desaturase (delta-9 desaturase)
MDFSKTIKIVEASIFKTQVLYILNTIVSLLFIATQGITLPNIAIVLFLFFIMNCVGITVTFHRYWTHSSFVFKYKWLEKLCTLCGILSGSDSSIGWANIHRQHHLHSDTELDPHSAEKGFFKKFKYHILMPHQLLKLDYSPKSGPRYVRRLLRNKFLVKTHQLYYLIIMAYCLFLSLAFGLSGLILGFCMPSALTMVAQILTNLVNHKNKNTYEPANVWWMNILSFGDGWHKNHHDDQSNYTTKTKWFELDISGLVIKHCLRKA